MVGGISGVVGLDGHRSAKDNEPARGEEKNLIGYEWNRGNDPVRLLILFTRECHVIGC